MKQHPNFWFPTCNAFTAWIFKRKTSKWFTGKERSVHVMNTQSYIWGGQWGPCSEFIKCRYRIGIAIVCVLSSSVVECGFEPRSGQTKDCEICIFCFLAKDASLASNSRIRLARNQNNVPEWSDMFTRGLLFWWASTTQIQLNVLV